MNPITRTWLVGVGFYIGGVSVFWGLHQTDVLDKRFWIGFVISGFVPVGTYLIGLAQDKPWGRNNG
jgi:hypothetical protein